MSFFLKNSYLENFVSLVNYNKNWKEIVDDDIIIIIILIIIYNNFYADFPWDMKVKMLI